MRGISFRSKEGIDNTDFIKIFNNLNLYDYKIRITYQEFYNSDDSSEFEISENISWQKFLNLSTENNFYTIFLEMFLYKNDIIKTIPKVYSEYLKSDCMMVVFISDSSYIDVYSKDDNITKKIMGNTLNKRYYNQEYTTDENDCRTRFSVW